MPVGLADVNVKRLAQYLLLFLFKFSSRVLPTRLKRTLGQREHSALKKWSSGLETMNNSGFLTQPSCHRWEAKARQAFIGFVNSASTHWATNSCPDCETELKHRDCTFFYEGQTREIPLPICVKCHPITHVVPTQHSNHYSGRKTLCTVNRFSGRSLFLLERFPG